MLLRSDVFEQDDELVVQIEVPGIDPDAIDVRVGEASLLVRLGVGGCGDGRRYHRRERGLGTFRREIALPLPVIVRLADARVRDGLLTVRLPLARKPWTERRPSRALAPARAEGAPERPDPPPG